MSFYLPFQKSFKPLISKGKTKIQFIGKDSLEFVKGRRGFGLKIIERAPYQNPIGYINHHMFSKNEGTIALWVNPVGWGVDAQNHYFLAVSGDNVNFMIYKFFPGDTWVYVSGAGKSTVVGDGWNGWKSGQWTFLCFTFNPNEQSFYVNGKLQGRAITNLIAPHFSKTSQLEIMDGSQVIDEVMTFNKALTEKEVKAIYMANKPLVKNN